MGRKRKILKSDDADKHLQLPPCRVCEGPAGGFHYGVNTCEACKGFFHRSSSGKEELKCETGGTCPVTYTLPRMCKKCRYDKCIAVGMAKQAIKTGRYTVEKRTKDILEIKSLQGKKPSSGGTPNKTTSKKSDSNSKEESHTISMETTEQDVKPDKFDYPSPQSNPQDAAFNHPSTISSGQFSCCTSHNTSMDCSPGQSLSPLSQPDQMSPYMSNISNASSPCMSFSSPRPLSVVGGAGSCDNKFVVDNIDSPSTSQCPCSQVIHELYSDPDKVVEVLVQGRDNHIKYLLPNKSEEELEKMAKDHMEVCQLQQEMFGTMTRLPDQDYDSIYASTGLDADGRMQRLDNYNNLMEIYIRAIAKFAKCVPGFSHLDIHDQVTLIKYSRNEFMIFMGFNEIVQGAIFCADKKMHCKSCVDIAGNKNLEDLMDYFVQHCKSVKNLKLTIEERVLISSIVLMAPDRENWVNSEKAKLIYELLNNCLIELFRKRYTKPLQMYAKAVSVMVGVRTFNFESVKLIRSFRFDKYSNVLHNPLLREMFGGIYFDDFESPETECDDHDNHTLKSL
ncbi:hypothetical protein EGW08_005000 [Elysia chlorotica]|uniref:Nuclear receptor domain-containing protein n=1 Tax=Elysia chlorotica TaxID=188477 RepID=A0A433U0H7_ELYCH|nr:hypothetical protein EGW08_005000 [Elysia chlorotica]